MVCSIYRNTVHITCLYGSLDPSQPTILHRNTCAHEMNVVSTALVLLHTPADINGMLSVVFVGAGRLDAKSLQKMFRLRKQNMQDFLLWLKDHNHLYANMALDLDVLNLYPDDGSLPGIENHIIQDNETCPEQAFLEETAGFSDHHAQLFPVLNLLNHITLCLRITKVLNADKLESRTWCKAPLPILLY